MWSESEKEVEYGEEVSRRLAIVNLDWDHIRAVDLLALLGSFSTGSGVLEKVEIFPSEFGVERMAADATYGPPKQIFRETQLVTEPVEEEELDDEALEKKKERNILRNRFEAVQDEDETRGFNATRLRRYEIEKQRYYFAVATFSSVEAANHVYRECDGLDFELSTIKLDLRFVPDSIKEFPHAPKDSATEVPMGYKAPKVESRARGHTQVRPTWDADDPKRIAVVRKNLS